MTETTLGFEIPQVVEEVDHWLRHGKPELGWRGDPRLSLEIGVQRATRYGKDPRRDGKWHRPGDAVAWQRQVHRHCETGKDEIVLQLKGHDLYTIFDRLVKMDPRTPGFEDVMDTVEREDALVQKHVEDKMKDARGEATEHLWALVQEKTHGRATTRQVGGSDERPDRNLAKS